MQNLFNSTNLDQTSSPEDLGIDSSLIKNFISDCEKCNYNFKNIIIGRHGKIATRIVRKPFDPSFTHTSFSSAKPIVALAIGFAVCEGVLRLDTTIEELFGDKLSDKEIKKIKGITVEHLLTMTAGKSVSLLFNKEKDDWFDTFINSKVIGKPGEKFKYVSENTYMLGRILSEVTGLTISEYLRPRLLEPLGIEKFYWETDKSGYEAGAWGMFWTVDDMAKIAQLFLNRGKWDGVQIVPVEWLDMMITPHISGINTIYAMDKGFGYQTWPNYEGTFYRFEGLYGQYIFVYPQYDAFVVMQSGDIRQYDFFPIVEKYFPEAFKEDRIEITSAQREDYNNFIENISYPILKGGPRNLATEQALNMNCYKMVKMAYSTMQSAACSFVQAKKPGKMTNIVFNFKENYAEMKWDEKSYGTNKMIISLDSETRYSTITLGQFESHVAAYGKWLPSGKLQVQVISIESPDIRTFVFKFTKKYVFVKAKVDSGLYDMVRFKLFFMGFKNVPFVKIVSFLADAVAKIILYPPFLMGKAKKNKISEENKS